MSHITCRLGVCLSLILFTYLIYCGLISFVSRQYNMGVCGYPH